MQQTWSGSEDGLTADGILLIVEGGDNLSCPVEILGGSVSGEEKVPDKEHEVHEGSELDRPAVAGAFRVFTGLEAEVDANGDQVGNVVGSGVRGGSCIGNDGLDDPEGDCLFSSDREIFEAVGLELPCEALVESVCAWESAGCLGSERPSRRWAVAIAPHA